MCAVFEMRGGGSGGLNPQYLHRTLAFVLSKGTQDGSLKDPPKYQNVFYELFQAPKHH